MNNALRSPVEEVSRLSLNTSAFSVPRVCERGQQSRMTVERSVRYCRTIDVTSDYMTNIACTAAIRTVRVLQFNKFEINGDTVQYKSSRNVARSLVDQSET